MLRKFIIKVSSIFNKVNKYLENKIDKLLGTQYDYIGSKRVYKEEVDAWLITINFFIRTLMLTLFIVFTFALFVAIVSR